MSSITTLARPYARAAFEIARDAGALAEWSRQLDFAAAVARDPSIAALIGDPRLGPEALPALFVRDGEAAGAAYGAFIATLAANRRLPAVPEIARLFAGFKRDHERVLHVTVRAAAPVEPAQAAALKAALQRRFEREIELTTSVDESLIGGAVIDAGEVTIDGSVRRRLEQLEAALTH